MFDARSVTLRIRLRFHTFLRPKCCHAEDLGIGGNDRRCMIAGSRFFGCVAREFLTLWPVSAGRVHRHPVDAGSVVTRLCLVRLRARVTPVGALHSARALASVDCHSKRRIFDDHGAVLGSAGWTSRPTILRSWNRRLDPASAGPRCPASNSGTVMRSATGASST